MSRVSPSVAEALRRVKSQPDDAPVDKASAFLKLGDALETDGQLDRAAKAYGSAVRLQPSSHAAYYALGVALGKAKKAAPAARAFEAARSIFPTHAQTHRAFALTASMLGKPEAAERALRAALRLDPAFDDAQFELGIALQQLQRPTEALFAYNALLSRSPDSAPALTNRGTVLKDTSRPAEAAEAYAKAIRVQPRLVEAYNNLAVLAAGDLKQPERALRLIAAGRAIGGAATALEWDSARGLALTQLRRLAEAAAAFGAAVSSNPSSADLKCHLLVSRMRVSDWRDASWLVRDARRELGSGGCERAWDPLYGLAAPLPGTRGPLLLTLARRVASQKERAATEARIQLSAAPSPPRKRALERSRGAGALLGAAPSLPGWPTRPTALSGGAASHIGGAHRLRVGYLSADYRKHVMAFLTRGLVERSATSSHLEVFALSLARDDGAGWQRDFRRAVRAQCCSGGSGATVSPAVECRSEACSGDRQWGGAQGADYALDSPFFVDLTTGSQGVAALARRIAALRLHVLIDLNGYTTDERSDLLAFKPGAQQAICEPSLGEAEARSVARETCSAAHTPCSRSSTLTSLTAPRTCMCMCMCVCMCMCMCM